MTYDEEIETYHKCIVCCAPRNRRGTDMYLHLCQDCEISRPMKRRPIPPTEWWGRGASWGRAVGIV